MLRLLTLAALVAVTLWPADSHAKCKNAHCRFHAAELAPKYGYGPYRQSAFPDERFEYEKELLASDGRFYVQRFYQINLNEPFGSRPDRTTLFRPMADVHNELYHDAYLASTYWKSDKKRKKRAKKFYKKETLSGRALDIVYEFKPAGELALMRVGLRPLNFDHTAGFTFDRYLSVPLAHTGYNANAPKAKRATTSFRIELPDMQGVAEGEMRYSEWQFCASCVRSFMENSKQPLYPTLDVKAFYEANGVLPTYFAWPVAVTQINSLDYSMGDSLDSGVEIFAGDEAVAAATNYFEAERLAEEARQAEAARKAQLADMYKEERDTYNAYVAELKAGSLRTSVGKRCGKLDLRSPPNPRARGSHSGWFEDNAKYNVREYEAHVGCVLNTLETFDYPKRAAALEHAQTRLPELFSMASFEDQRIASFETTRKEVDRQQKYLKAQEARYQKLERDFDRAWDVMMDVYAERREKRINEEVSKCLAGLAMTNSLTSNSRAYCRSMAEQGYTGLSAAAAGFKGSGSGSSSGSATASFTQPAVQAFDLSGMIANAQAVADGADASLLWNDDGTINTTLSQQAVDFQQRQAEERERERQRIAASQPLAAGATVTTAVSTPAVDQTVAAVGKVASEASQSGESTAAAASSGGAGNAINITVTTAGLTAEQMRDLDNGGDGRVGSTTTRQDAASGTDSGVALPNNAGGSANLEQAKPRRDTKFIWIGELSLERKAWPSSSRERADTDFRNTLAVNHLNDFCRKTYAGSDGFKGIKDVNLFDLEERPGKVWHGKATIEGYCRVMAHHEAYPEIRWCVSESAGQADCAVSQRH